MLIKAYDSQNLWNFIKDKASEDFHHKRLTLNQILGTPEKNLKAEYNESLLQINQFIKIISNNTKINESVGIQPFNLLIYNTCPRLFQSQDNDKELR